MAMEVCLLIFHYCFVSDASIRVLAIICDIFKQCSEMSVSRFRKKFSFVIYLVEKLVPFDCLVDSWISHERFAFLDLSAGPFEWSPIGRYFCSLAFFFFSQTIPIFFSSVLPSVSEIY